MAGVLKANQVGATSGGLQPIAFNLHDVEEAAKSHLEEVRKKTQQLIEQAKQDAERIRKEAGEQARREALAEMEAKFQQRSKDLAEKQTNEAIQSLKNVMKELQQATEQWLGQWRDETLTLALAIAEKIIRRRIESEADIVLGWLTESTTAWSGARRIEIRLSSKQFAELAPRVADLLKPFAGQATCDVIEDSKVEAGGCLVKTDLGVMDWQISAQLGSLEEQLK
jgi:flagellar assembly protein FliH